LIYHGLVRSNAKEVILAVSGSIAEVVHPSNISTLLS